MHFQVSEQCLFALDEQSEHFFQVCFPYFLSSECLVVVGNGHRDVLHAIFLFSVETISNGRESAFHCATSASVVRIFSDAAIRRRIPLLKKLPTTNLSSRPSISFGYLSLVRIICLPLSYNALKVLKNSKLVRKLTCTQEKNVLRAF